MLDTNVVVEVLRPRPSVVRERLIRTRDYEGRPVAVSSVRSTLVTANTREFSRVPGLLLEDWSLPE